MIKKKMTFSVIIVLFSLLTLINVNNNNNVNVYEFNSFEQITNRLKTSASPVNGKTLLVSQYANITKSYNNVKSGDNVSYTLYDNWVSQNTTINYEGVAHKRDVVTNGAFDSDDSGWLFKTNIPSKLDKWSWDSTRGYPDSDGCTGLDGGNTARDAGDYGYLEQNITLQNEVFRDDIATFSFNYNSDFFIGFNASLFMSISIGDIEINHSVYIPDIPLDTWFTLIMNYNPISYGQVLPGVATVRVGLIMNENSGPGWVRIYLDNFKYELWSESNEKGILKAFDNQFSLNHTYYNITFGEGYSFITTERISDLDHQIDFTIYKNMSRLSDFKIDTITVISHAIKKFNSTVSNNLGSLYTLGENISWQVEFSLTLHVDYYIWIFIEKPSDWAFIHVLDSFEDDIIDFCIGKGRGSILMEIPSNKVSQGLWKLEAISKNYISDGILSVWNSNTFVESINLTHGNLFRLSISLNDSISLPNTQLNFSIYYPNASLFRHISREPTTYNEIFGNFTVGKNMTVGKYSVLITWVNNQSYLARDKVGFLQLEFNVWHHTNLIAVNSNFEQIAGDPLLLRVKFLDFDLNSSIHFATISYNSTFGTSGTMVYLGSGEYFIDVDTNSLSLGSYYFSFNASKQFYENQTIDNLIHLKIVAQPLDLEVPHYALEGNANSIISCKINSTGAISGTKIYPVNISTDWFNPHNITDHSNGTYTLDFSTINIPTSGFLESFNIEIFANKTNYGSTNEFITLLVHPLSTEASVNNSLVSVNSNNVVNLKVNYTIEGSSEIITGSNCSVTWQGSFLITPVLEGFNIKLFTSGLAVDYYTALIKLEKVGHEVAFESVTVIIIEQDVNLTVSINSEEISENFLIDSFFQQTINITARAFALIDAEYLSGGEITLMSNSYQNNLTEVPSTYFTDSMILDGANFDSGINTIFLRFEQANYTTKIFPFQLFIRAQNVNISTEINFQEVPENFLLEGSFNEEFQISCRAFADIEGVFLSGANMTFINGEYEVELTENADYWFNHTILISTLSFTIGPNYAYLRFEQNNYTTTIFALQILVNQLEIDVEILGSEGIVSGAPGETVLIRLNLTESGSSIYIDNATIFYSCTFSVGYFEYIGSGIYELKLNLPSSLEGNYDFELIVSKEGITYETKVYSFFIAINQVEGPNLLMLIIIIGLIALSGIFGVLSLRSYVILPKRREKEADLISRIQVYKDVWNIRAVILIQKLSGLPIYSEEISMSEDHDSFLISGFIQAITAFSETFVDKEFKGALKLATDYEYLRTIIDLDFKFFQLLVCDYKSIRILLVLREEASDQLKKQLYTLAVEINSQYNEKIESFAGSIGSSMKKELGNILNQFLFLHYNKPFEITQNQDYLQSLTDSDDLSKMEKRLINTISSMVKINKMFTLKAVIDLIEEKNEDLVLEALNSLILRKVILSPYSTKLYQKKEKKLRVDHHKE